MRNLAVMADIHGNSFALRAVLADLAAVGGVEAVLILGDLAVFGPDPVGVLSLLKQFETAFFVRGNTDRYLAENQYPLQPHNQGWQAQILASFPWAARQLGQAGLQFLAELPHYQQLRLTPQHNILAVHGSPRSDEEGIKFDTPERELAALLMGRTYNLLFSAHTHLPCDRMVNGCRLVNVGSVGLPFDGNRRACYVLAKLEPGGNYQIEFRRVAYDVEAVVHQLAAVKHPALGVAAYNLRTARPLDQKLVYTQKMRPGRAEIELTLVPAGV